MNAPIVTVRGEATREVDPDLATLTATVHASGPSSEAVNGRLARGSATLAEVAARFDDALERSGGSRMTVHPVFDRRHATKITGYRGSFSNQLVVRDFAVLSDLVLALGAVSDAQVFGPWWSLRPENEAYREVRIEAIADARRRAEDYASAFGARLDGLVEVSDLTESFAPPMARAFAIGAMAKDAGEPAFDFQPAVQTVSGQVTVRFTITSPLLGG
ncbi:MAG TPA: SIMPL domain-containing protein [Microlunatus sp.]|nr:SIMPL domain-containing protein [Microlunatus sp.]